MLTQEEFAQKMVEVIFAHYPGATVKQRLPFGVVFTRPGSRLESMAFFDNPYGAYLRHPEQLDETIMEWLQARDKEDATRQTAKEWMLNEAKSYILPILRHARSLETARQQFLSTGELVEQLPKILPVVKSVTNSLFVQYAIDMPGSTALEFVTPAMQDRWEVSVEALHRLAMSNLLARTQQAGIKINVANTEESGTFYQVEPRDEYSASRILLRDVLDAVVDLAKDDLVITIPRRDLLIAVVFSSPNGVAWLKRVAPGTFEAATTGGWVSPDLYVYRRQTGAVEELSF